MPRPQKADEDIPGGCHHSTNAATRLAVRPQLVAVMTLDPRAHISASCVHAPEADLVVFYLNGGKSKTHMKST